MSAYPFWIWNKRNSPPTLTPTRRASGKLPFKVRVLRALVGAPLYRRGARRMKLQQREQHARRVAELIRWGLRQ